MNMLSQIDTVHVVTQALGYCSSLEREGVAKQEEEGKRENRGRV